MPFSTEQKALVVGMREAGMPVTEISWKLHMNIRTIYSIIKRKSTRGTVVTPKRSGRPKIISDDHLKTLAEASKANRRATMTEIAHSLPFPISKPTARKALASKGIRSRIAAKKPFLSERHTKARLEFALAHKEWTTEDWKRVVWTDESTFEIGKYSRQPRVLRAVGEKYIKECLAPTFKSGRTSLMIWGAISYNKKSEIVFMDKNRRTGTDYIEVVCDGPLKAMMSSIPGAILMEDGAPVHRTIKAKEWKQQNSIVALKWPAQSPDLNPIENVWKLMKDYVQRRNPPVKTIDDMKNTLIEFWRDVDINNINKLICSVPDRIASVIENQGGSTRW